MAAETLPPPDGFVAGLLAAVSQYDFEGCDQQFARALAELEPLVVVRDVAAPALREAGNRWQRGEWTVAQEHLLSGVVRQRLSAALDRHLRDAADPSILFTTLSGERHELGGLMGAVVAASRGYRSLYLGSDLPVRDICHFCAHLHVDVLALGLVTQPDVNDARVQLEELRRGIPVATGIWVAGQSANLLGQEHLPAGVFVIADLVDFLDRLGRLKVRTP